MTFFIIKYGSYLRAAAVLLIGALNVISLERYCTAQASNSSFTYLEAESHPQGEVVPDPAASGGSYVIAKSPWLPTITASLPACGQEFTIWVRYRGEQLQLKGVAPNGVQKELNWLRDVPATWSWRSFGVHTRQELGASLLVIRGQNAQPGAGVDSMVISTDASFDPNRLALSHYVNGKPTFAPPPRLSVRWGSAFGTAGPASFGLNVFQGFDPEHSHNPIYSANVEFMRAGIIRYHNWGVMNDSTADPNGWVDTRNRCWDEAKVKRAMVGAYKYGPSIMINIPMWPKWMESPDKGYLQTGQESAFADWCAQLVKIVNVDLKLNIKYWEVTNERDGPYFVDMHDDSGRGSLKDASNPDRVEELARIYVTASQAMRKVDPTIKVGGPAASRPDLVEFTRRFLKIAGPDLDFYSIHSYASGSASDSDDHIYDRTADFGNSIKSTVNLIRQTCPGRHIDTMLDEYNISWTWDVRDPRMTTNKGVVFDALTMYEAILNGATATMAWNECDGVYGKLDQNNACRPGAALFHMFNKLLQGTWVRASWDGQPDGKLVSCGISDPIHRSQYILLINRADQSCRVSLAGRPFQRATDTARMRYVISSKGFSALPSVADGDDQTVTLPDNSITLISNHR